MKRIAFLTLCLVGLVGCTDNKQPGNSVSSPSTTNSDNTGVNVRDRDASGKTPFDQKENKSDIDLTANIRKSVVSSDMSSDAKNVKIISENGHVTLRGPVKSADEKTQIEKIAVQVAGEGKVDNQLEIASQR